MRTLLFLSLVGLLTNCCAADLVIDDFSSAEYVRTGEFHFEDPGTMLGGERRSSSFSNTDATVSVGNGVYSIAHGTPPMNGEGFYLSWGTSFSNENPA